MRALFRSLVLALASLTVLAAGAVTNLGSPVAAESRGAPAISRYTASFVADLELRQRANFGSGDYAESEGLVKVSGTLPAVRFAGVQLLGSYGAGRLTTSGTASSTLATDGGGNVTTCAGKSVSPATSVPPNLQAVMGKNTFYAFSSLSAKVECVNSDDLLEPPWTEVRELPAVPVPVAIRAAEIGAHTIKLPFTRTLPAESCPGYDGDHDEYCVYRLKGTLTLRLVPDIDVFHKPTDARLSKAGSRASVVAGCSAACTATVTVRPLRGAGCASVRKPLTQRDSKTLRVGLGKKLRKSVVRGGGARIEVTYRSGGVTKTFKRKVRFV